MFSLHFRWMLLRTEWNLQVCLLPAWSFIAFYRPVGLSVVPTSEVTNSKILLGNIKTQLSFQATCHLSQCVYYTVPSVY